MILNATMFKGVYCGNVGAFVLYQSQRGRFPLTAVTYSIWKLNCFLQVMPKLPKVHVTNVLKKGK